MGGELQARGLTVKVGESLLLEGVDLDLSRGEVAAVIGPSGAGKTTLIRALTGLVPLLAGEVTWQGRRLLPGDSRSRGQLTGVVQPLFQDPGESLNPRRRVGSIVATGCPWGRLPRREIDELLRRVGLNPALADRYPHQLSGGERQRVALARALAVEPEVLLLDEPFTGLDPPLVEEMKGHLSALADGGPALLLVTHDLGQVVDMARRVGVMDRGRFIEWGETAELLARPVHSLTARLVACYRDPLGREGADPVR